MLFDLIILEQFKNIVPEHIATYINERKPKDCQETSFKATEAAVLADDYMLTCKKVYREEKSSHNYGNFCVNRSVSKKFEQPYFSKFYQSYRGKTDRDLV